MATFRKRSNSWQARIQRTGNPDISKNFKMYAEAVAWARSVEVKLDTSDGRYETTELSKATFSDLLLKYKTEVTSLKSLPEIEGYRINAWLKSDLANKSVAAELNKLISEGVVKSHRFIMA